MNRPPTTPAAIFLAFLLILIPASALAADASATQPATEPAVTLFPADGATNVCPDTPLKMTFPSTPEHAAAGTIKIIDTATNEPVDTIDFNSPNAVQTIGGLPHFSYRAILIADHRVTFYPRNHALAYNKTYSVTIDPGVFQASQTPATWRFTTKTFAPVAGSTQLTIAADGAADFCTLQAALDFIPDGNRTPTTLTLRPGLYTELIFFTNKHDLTIHGEDRDKTIIAYANNAIYNRSNDQHTYHRGVFLARDCYDLTLDNLTIRNTTPRGGSQAEALILSGTPTAQAKLTNVSFFSFQDTLQINGQAYLNNCYIEGDVDFMWGSGPCFFENCDCKITRSKAYFTQIRNPASNHGYVYYHCTFEGPPGITGAYLARIDPKVFPYSEVALIDCTLDGSVGDYAWLLNKPRGASAASTEPSAPNVHFWEFNSHTADGKPIDTTKRLPISRQLTQPQDADTIANYSNPTWVLGNDWNPRPAQPPK